MRILVLALLPMAAAQGQAANEMHNGIQAVMPLIGLGTLDMDQRRFTDAQRQFVQALEVLGRREFDAPASAELRILGLSGLALATLRVQGPEEALRIAREALEYARERFGPEHRLTALAMNQMGIIVLRSGTYHDAAALFAEAARILERQDDPQTEHLGRLLLNLCVAQSRLGLHSPADKTCTRARAYLHHIPGADLGLALEEQARIYRCQGRRKEARQLQLQAASLRSRIYAQGGDAFADWPGSDLSRGRLAVVAIASAGAAVEW